MVPTLIAGVYGMNFTPLVPAEDSAGGFWFAVVLMSLGAGGVALILKRSDWL